MEKLSEDFIIEEAIKASGGTDWCVVSFSCGKDSLASFLRLWEKKVFKNFLLIHQYYVKDISFIENYLNYFADKFPECVIYDCMAPLVIKMRNGSSLCDFRTAKSLDVLRDKNELFYPYKYQEMVKDITLSITGKERKNAIGVKYSDSTFRRFAANSYLRKGTIISEPNFAYYPIIDYAPKDVWGIIKKHKIKMSKEYELFGKSLDGLDPVFSLPIKEKYPEDYKRIQSYFPQIDVVLKRKKWYGI